MDTLSQYYDQCGFYLEGETVFAQAAGTLSDADPTWSGLRYRQARFAFRLGRNEAARVLAVGALAKLETAAAPADVANCLLVLGNAVRDMGDHAAARDHFARSAALFESLDDLPGFAAAANNLGVIFYYEDDLPAATSQFVAALEARERAGVEDVTVELGNVGLCYGEMGAYDRAITYLERSLALARRLKAPLAEGLARHNLGNAYRNSGAPETAVAHLSAGIRIFRELGSRDALAAALADLAAAQIALGKYAAAEAALLEGLQLENALSRPRGIAFKQLGLGNLRLAEGRDTDAARHFRKVLAHSEEEAGSSPLLNALLGLAVVAARRGDDALLPAVLATVHAHPRAGHETRENAAAWAARLSAPVDPAAAHAPEALPALIALLVDG